MVFGLFSKALNNRWHRNDSWQTKRSSVYGLMRDEIIQKVYRHRAIISGDGQLMANGNYLGLMGITLILNGIIGD